MEVRRQSPEPFPDFCVITTIEFDGDNTYFFHCTPATGDQTDNIPQFQVASDADDWTDPFTVEWIEPTGFSLAYVYVGGTLTKWRIIAPLTGIDLNPQMLIPQFGALPTE